MSFSVTVLGCSGTYAGPGGACSGYLLRTASTALWMDCGPGTLANLQRHVGLEQVDGIVITHEHADHWLELPVVRNALRYGLGLPDRELPVLWTAGTADRFRALSPEDEVPTFAPRVVDEHATEVIGDIALRFSRTDHPVETLAVRADVAGRSIAYSSDTGNEWSLASLGADIDLAIVEATLEETDEGSVQHLSGRQAGSQAAQAGVASLLVTHVMPVGDPQRRLAEAAAAFGGPTALAETNGRHEV